MTSGARLLVSYHTGYQYGDSHSRLKKNEKYTSSVVRWRISSKLNFCKLCLILRLRVLRVLCSHERHNFGNIPVIIAHAVGVVVITDTRKQLLSKLHLPNKRS